jgi:hypothetical protein
LASGQRAATGGEVKGCQAQDKDARTACEASGCVQHGIVKRSLLPEEIGPRLAGRLEKLARLHWPDPWRSVILSTLAARRVFAMPIAECVPKRLTRGRLALMGEAAHVLVPATGAGLFTGLEDVKSLGRAIEVGPHGGPSDLGRDIRATMTIDEAIDAVFELLNAGFLKFAVDRRRLPMGFTFNSKPRPPTRAILRPSKRVR